MNTAAKWLKKMREEEKISLRKLGELSGLSHQTVSDAETKGFGTTDTWIKLAEHFGESVLRVLYWAKKMKRPPTDDEVILELQNKITLVILEAFPKSEWETVLKHAATDVEYLRKRRNGQ